MDNALTERNYFKATISIKAAHITVPHTGIAVPVRVRNDSPAPWPAGEPIHLSYHVHDETGAVVIWDGARAPLPHAMPPGSEVLLNCLVRSPGKRMRGTLEFDMVLEHVAWFAEKGSSTFTVPCLFAD